MFVNGSEQDLKVLGSVNGIYKLNGYDGFAGHRERAMNCLCDNEEFTEALEKITQKIIVLIYATGGSTGSGLSTNVAQYIMDIEAEKYDEDDYNADRKIIVTVPVLPSRNESINKYKNTYQASQELMALEGAEMGASYFLDNNSCDGKDLRWINNTFCTIFDAFLSDDSWGEPNNFDEAERIEMLSERGFSTISRSKDAVKKIFTDNIFAPMQGDKVCGNIGIIHGSANDVNIDELIAEVGKPLNIYEGWNGKSTLIAVSGMSYPLDYITSLGKLAVEGQRERQKNLENAKKQQLPTLEFEDIKRVNPSDEKKKKEKPLTGRERLLAMRQKARKTV
jgi:hypothetical protein